MNSPTTNHNRGIPTPPPKRRFGRLSRASRFCGITVVAGLIALAPWAALGQGVLYGSASDTDVRKDGVVVSASATSLLSGGSGSPALDRSSVLVFQLPEFGTVATPFTSAKLQFNLGNLEGTPPNVNLYGLARRTGSTVQPGDYFGETSTTDPTDATLLQTDILVASLPLGVKSTSTGGGTALRDYLNVQYANGAGAGKYVFLRLSTNSAVSSVVRYNVTSADGGGAGPPDTRPQIRYNYPEPYARPFIWVRDTEKAGIQSKIASNAWATAVFDGMVSRVAAAVASHQSNRDAYLRGLPVNWTAAPPRFNTGASSYSAGEGYFNTALDCAVLYYLSGNASYARCAADILHNSVQAFQSLAPSSSVGNGGWLIPGDLLYEARQVGGQLPVVYDFLSQYLQTNQVYDVAAGALTGFSFPDAQFVFRTYYQLVRDHGQRDSNWSALMSTCMLNNLLAMDSESERDAALQVYLTTGSSRQASLDYDYRQYTQPGDIWPESLQYSGGVGEIRSTHMVLLERIDPSLNLFDSYPNLPLSLPRISYLRYPNGEQISFGDGHRAGQGHPYSRYELMYQHALARGRTDLTSLFGSLINGGVAAGSYNRSTSNDYSNLGQHDEPLQLLWGASAIPEPSTTPTLPRTDTLAFAGIALQRNPAPVNNSTYGLMCFVGGAGHVHSHASGMSMELFGMGQVMGAKSGRTTYGDLDNENHYRLFAANNTVIVNGASRGEGGWNGFDINTVHVVAMEPQPQAAAVSPNFSFTCSSFDDNKGTLAEGTQQRTMAIVRTSPTTGFYVDLFRSRSTVTNRTATTLNGTVTNQYHDYIYRNFGETAVDLRADGVTLPLVSQPTRFQNDIGDANAQPGWRYFTNTVVSYPTSASVRAQFVATVSGTARYMDVHLPAVASREYAKLDSPAIVDAPSPYDGRVSPTLVIRQIGEAWNRAFATAYEPHFGSTGGTIENVTQLLRSGIVVGMKVESTAVGRNLVHYVISNPGAAETYTDPSVGLSFTGRFGIVADSGHGYLSLYLGQGSTLSYQGYSISTVSGANSQAEARFSPGKPPSVTANAAVNTVDNPGLFPAWSPTAAGNAYDWTNSANWYGANFPNAVGAPAPMDVDLTGDQSILLNIPITLSELLIGDTSGSQSVTLQAGSGGTLTFNNTGTAGAYLRRSNGGVGTVTLAADLGITLADDLTVLIDGGTATSSLTIASNLSGPGKGIIKESERLTLRLSGTNTNTGPTTLSAGVLRLDGINALPPGNLVLTGGGVLGLSAGNLSRGDGTGAGEVQWTGHGGFAAFGANRSVTTGTLSWNSSSLGGKTLILGHPTADATITWSSNLSFAGGSRTIQVQNGSAAIDATISGALSGGGALHKNGPGTLAFTNNSNSYTASTNINEGTLMLGNGGTAGRIPTTSGTLTNHGTLAVNRSNFASQATDLGGKIIMGTGGFAQVGSGTTVLSLANTYGGPTLISAGTLTLGASNVLPDTTAASIGSAILDVATFTDAAGTLDVAGAATIKLGTGAALAFAKSAAISWSGGALTVSGAFVPGVSLRFGTDASGLTSSQLALISVTGFTNFGLDANGYLTAVPVPEGYNAWAAINAPTGTAADDFDSDGVANGVEYVLGGNKDTFDGDQLPALSTSSGTMAFMFVRDQASIDGSTIVQIQVSPDLADWTATYSVPDGAAVANPGVTVVKGTPSGFDTVTLALPLSPGTRKYVRLRVVPGS